MNQRVTIRCTVAGGAVIGDLGIELSNGETKEVSRPDVERSSDLSKAVKDGRVETVSAQKARKRRKRHLSGDGASGRSRKSTHRKKRPSPVSESSEDPTESSEEGRSIGDSEIADLVSRLENALAAERDRADEVMVRQIEVLESIDSKLDRSAPRETFDVDRLVNALSGLGSGVTQDSSSVSSGGANESDVPQFIPEKISTGKIKGGDDIEAESGTADSSSIDDAAGALAAFKNED